ncbi:coiled-coil domain-containing protein [Actinomadura sediminis]|uniref:Coiled-coil domain-containing protein n=1 Tax=Actinomadura sediminis TaxID=1038904 RepID=A0ABW3EX88_9ACTN
MAALDPPGGTERPDRGRPTARRARTGALALALALGVTAVPSARAAAVPAAPEDPAAKYAKLKKRADKLSKEYRGGLVSLEDAEKAAKEARAAADRASGEYDRARAAVATIASTTYMTGRYESIPIVTDGDPQAALRAASGLEHISRNNGRRVQALRALDAQAEQAREKAEAKLEKVEKEIEDLESQRERVKKLLAKYKPEKPTTSASSGSGSARPDGASGTKSPVTGNSMTARMRTVLQEVDGKFGPFPTIGCLRPGDPQDHGSGRACDFMESTGGRMPSASASAHGDKVAQYLIDNASRLGIKYIIWKQRIWDSRSSGGWRQMEDRGSVTQNHYDHVHVSVL